VDMIEVGQACTSLKDGSPLPCMCTHNVDCMISTGFAWILIVVSVLVTSSFFYYVIWGGIKGAIRREVEGAIEEKCQRKR
jgi:hypothetical protein